MPKSFTVALIIKLRCIIRSRLVQSMPTERSTRPRTAFVTAATAVPAVLFKLTRDGCFSRAANAVPVCFVLLNSTIPIRNWEVNCTSEQKQFTFTRLVVSNGRQDDELAS
ncbi:hypothetical protein Tsp_09636 [Trichinella spiralis]|uniref:hypothetical protein n=1 Tax=Trichinella spiralis TaxID=6334 RepID=UPI0001EFF048|nr:hypothetical protein Tsp_09636 [Trichinella spiralis]